MSKKSLLVLVILVVAAGGAFAQIDFNSMPKNTITVDFGPTIIGAAISGIGNAISEEGVSSSGFGIAFQYERQILEKVSVAGRFAYLGGGLGIKDSDAVLKMDLSSFSLEGHARYFPFGGTFFLDGMLGFANMSAKFSGEVITTGEKKEKVELNASRGFLKYGAKIGWRINFGRQGGFTFEPSFGYYGGIGLGDSLGKQLLKEYDDINIGEIDDLFSIIEKVIFIGGPRLTLAFGWRF